MSVRQSKAILLPSTLSPQQQTRQIFLRKHYPATCTKVTSYVLVFTISLSTCTAQWGTSNIVFSYLSSYIFLLFILSKILLRHSFSHRSIFSSFPEVLTTWFFNEAFLSTVYVFTFNFLSTGIERKSTS